MRNRKNVCQNQLKMQRKMDMQYTCAHASTILQYLAIAIKGRPLTTLTRFWPFLPTEMTFAKNSLIIVKKRSDTVDIFNTTYRT